MDEQLARAFDAKRAEYKEMVILRQTEVEKIGDLLEKKAQQLSSRGMKYKNVLIVLGVVVATKAALELAMLNVGAPKWFMSALSILFVLIGAAVAAVAQFEKSKRYEEKAGELKALSSSCHDFNRRFMSDYTKLIDPRSPELTLARLESLIDRQNDTLEHIWQRSVTLGADLSGIDRSYRIGD